MHFDMGNNFEKGTFMPRIVYNENFLIFIKNFGFYGKKAQLFMGLSKFKKFFFRSTPNFL
jgi:hypothetical protein